MGRALPAGRGLLRRRHGPILWVPDKFWERKQVSGPGKARAGWVEGHDGKEA